MPHCTTYGNTLRRETRKLVDDPKKLGAMTTYLGPPDWDTLTDTEKMLWCLRRNIENIRDCVATPWEEADHAVRSLQVRVYEVHMRVAKDMLSDRERAEGRRMVLDQIRDQMKNTEKLGGDTAAGAADGGRSWDQALAAGKRRGRIFQPGRDDEISISTRRVD